MNGNRLDELERRIARLESRAESGAAPERPARGANQLTGVLHAWRRDAEEQSLPGTVGYAGYVAGRELLWARQMPLAELLSADWGPAAGILESLGSLPRLALLRALLREGCRTNVDLQEALGANQGDATSGQLYHHLRELQGAGLITQRRRGEYDLAPQAVIPILTILAAAMNVATDPPVGPPIAAPQSN
ncbi:helix-turn-helix domain-containing protein [Plantactinospora sp. KLBMP9567]|uniref:helix-turn-helix domain-containing protein n=1 Tax=Plantactinospora sp. KLBMP9567 TaxID=3085900 RepID=UPI0029820064|nr:helix-turn-helix domain-containing protein [Plantactinospora sp. KLBMP9567]MDW5324791.1 helix-turn-helix domain-containing protein [Plantactinospora sp. KLBMP9567]